MREAQNAESKADFIHKLKIALKEAEETDYWLLLCKESKNYIDTTVHLEKINSIMNVLSKIIISTKQASTNSQINKSSN